MYLLFGEGRWERTRRQCVLPGAKAPTEERAAHLSMEGGRSLERPGATVSENNPWGTREKRHGAKKQGKESTFRLFGLLTPFSHWSVCQKLVGEAEASKGLVWFSLALEETKGIFAGKLPPERAGSIWPAINWSFIFFQKLKCLLWNLKISFKKIITNFSMLYTISKFILK